MKLGYSREELLAAMRSSGDPTLVAQADRLGAVKGWRPEQLFNILADRLGRDAKIDGHEVD